MPSLVIVFLLQLHAASALVLGVPIARPLMVAGSPAASSSLLAPRRSASAAVHRRAGAPQMGLFGLGAPELAIIAGVALLILGPDQVKKLAKDVGKVSAELKQVPEEFSKGMEMGKEELESKKGSTVAPMLSSPSACAAEPRALWAAPSDRSPPARSLQIEQEKKN
eukprot:scaffold5320_cov138-Isochrysis_galbana.AAC.1